MRQRTFLQKCFPGRQFPGVSTSVHFASGSTCYALLCGFGLGYLLSTFSGTHFRVQLKITKLTTAQETRRPEDEMHCLQVRFDFGDRLQAKPPQDSSARALHVVLGWKFVWGGFGPCLCCVPMGPTRNIWHPVYVVTSAALRAT